MPRRHRIVQLAALVAALCGGEALAQPAGREMALGEAVPAPVGYVDFCRREPADCPARPDRPQGEFDKRYWSLAFKPAASPRTAAYRLDPPASIRRQGMQPPAAEAVPTDTGDAPSGRGRKIELTAAALADLERVTRDVNARIVSARDRTRFGENDHWDLPLSRGDGRGDCEDYVLEKRHALIGLGYPQDALSIALVRARRNETHAVLVVETTAGAYVLDSFSSRVLPWSAVTYRWVVRQSPDDPAVWVEVRG